MAWSVDNIYTYLRFLIRKNQAGAISSTDFFYVWNSEQYSYFQDLLGRFQARSNGKLGANTGLIENETIEIKLSPFIKTTTLAIAGGVSGKPSDFAYELALRINGYEVRRVNKNQVATVNDNVIDPPSIPLNIYYVHGFYNFLPNTVTAATLDYYSNPVDVSWVYTIVAGRQVYNQASSVQPMWLQTDIEEITKRCLKKLGVSFKDGDFANYGNSVINTGN